MRKLLTAITISVLSWTLLFYPASSCIFVRAEEKFYSDDYEPVGDEEDIDVFYPEDGNDEEILIGEEDNADIFIEEETEEPEVLIEEDPDEETGTEPDSTTSDDEQDTPECAEDETPEYPDDSDPGETFPEELPDDADAPDELPDSGLIPEELPDELMNPDGNDSDDSAISEDGEEISLSAPDSAVTLGSSGESVIYDLNTVYPFASRTEEAVIRRYSEALAAGGSYIDGYSSSYYASSCSTSAPYRAGMLTDDTLTAVTAAADYFRWLCGCNPLAGSATSTYSIQRAALVRNFAYSRRVSGGRPSGMDSQVWNEGASQQIDLLAHHHTPFDSIRAMVNSGYSLGGGYWSPMEDRETLLDPDLSLIRFGYSGDVAVGTVRERSNTARGAFTAFPPPGSMPAGLIDPSVTAWSVSLADGNLFIPDTGQLKVLVENLTGGGYYTCSEKSGRLRVTEDGTVAFLQPSPGQSGSYAGREYRVTVTGLMDESDGSEAAVTYTVQFVNIIPRVTSKVTGYSFDYSSLMIGDWGKNTDELRKAASVLPHRVSVRTASGAVCSLEVSGSWKLDVNNSCFYNSADASGLPSGVSDPNGILKRIEMPYSVSNTQRLWRTDLSFSANPAIIGTKVKVTVSRWDVGYNRSRVYRLRQDGNGGYTGTAILDSAVSDSFDEDTYSEYGHVYRMPVTAVSQGGTYIGIYFFSQFADAAYVTPPVTLTVKRPAVRYNAYVNGTGWTGYRTDGDPAGVATCASRISAFRVRILNEKNLGVSYSYAWKNSDWTVWKNDNAVSGAVSGRGPAAEAVRMKLTGSDASKYDLYYCVRVSGIGWMNWVKNGNPAGTRRRSAGICAIRVELRKKGSSAPARPGTTERGFLPLMSGLEGTCLNWERRECFFTKVPEMFTNNRKSAVFREKRGSIGSVRETYLFA